MSREEDIKKLIFKNQRALQKLKEKQAMMGIHTPHYIETAIEDTENENENLKQELAHIQEQNKESGQPKLDNQSKNGDKASVFQAVEVILLVGIVAFGGAVLLFGNSLLNSQSDFSASIKAIQQANLFRANVIQVQQSFPSDIADFVVIVDYVEFLDNEKMRWHFRFWNQTDQDYWLGFDPEKTYLADSTGQRYPLRATNALDAIEVQAGTRIDFWFEFDITDQAKKRFKIALESNAGSWFSASPNFPVFEVSLGK